MQDAKSKSAGFSMPCFSEKVKECKLPFLSALGLGLAAHMFAFTNKLVNADEVESLFGKGATVTSGRWGLEAVKLIFPDVSMPWLYGLVSLILLALASCIIVQLFEIRSPILRFALPGLITAFPAQTGVFCFMFTSAPYALAFLFSVLAVWLAVKKGLWGKMTAAVLMVLSLSIYQAYIAVTASLFVLWLIKCCLENELGVGEIILCGIKCLAAMLAALAVYCGITLLVLRLTGMEFNTYVTDNVNDISLVRKIRMAYDFFYYTFSYREFAYLSGPFSQAVHIFCLVFCAFLLTRELFWHEVRCGWLSRVVLMGLCALLPLAVNCMFLVMAKDSIHSLVLYSFVAVYVLAAMLTERLIEDSNLFSRLSRDIIYFSLLAVLVSNIFLANQCYLKLYLQYENAYSFYTVMLSRAQDLPGYDEGTKLAMIGHQDNKLYNYSQFDLGYLMGPSRDLINIYSREAFLRRYMGTDIPLATEEECAALAASEEFAELNEYPYYGSVAMIDGFAVVKLG